MDKESLRSDDIDFGRLLLLSTDAANMSCEGALWYFDADDNQWRFHLVTSLVDEIGPRRLYSLLDTALSRILSEAEVDHINIYISHPSDQLIAEIRKHITTAHTATKPIHITATADGDEIEAHVYRMAAALNEDAVKRARGAFKRRSNELIAEQCI